MGFSLDGNQWKQSFNWKPTTADQQTGGFASKPLVDEFAKAFRTAEGTLKGKNVEYSGFADGKASAAVLINDKGGSFTSDLSGVTYNLFGGTKADTLTGNAKGDFIQGGRGNDKLNGMGGNDELWGGAGDDTINGGEGRDVLYGNNGNDTLNGDAGDDLLLGDAGNDKLNGGDGNDFLVGGAGNDKMTGGKGADRFYLSELSGAGTKITDFNAKQGDNIWIIAKQGTEFEFTQAGKDVLIKDKKTGNLMATVENANKKDVMDKTQVGPSRFEGYDDTSRVRLEGLDSIKDVKNTSAVTKVFELKNGVTSEIDGFAYGSGHRLKLGAGVDAKDVSATITRDKVTIKDGNSELAILTPPTGTLDLGTWMKNVQKALKEIGVNANLPK